ncbi:MAG: hypothetical protein WBF99_12395 [Xanthobacteraceae bacterium]
MKFVGLDQALRNSGAAVLDGDRFVLAEAFHAKGVGQGKAFHEFRVWWTGFLRRHRPDWVAIEEPLRSDMTRTSVAYRPNDAFGKSVVKTKQPLTNMQTLLGLYGVRAHAIEVCEALGIEYKEINNQEWRSVIHGVRHAPKGTANSSEWWKGQALTRCKQLGWVVPSKDAAEAALIAEWLRIQFTPMGRVKDTDLFGSAA